MSRLTLFVASLVALCLVPLTVRAQEKLDVTAIAPWVDFGAYTVMRFDIERIDPAAVVNLSKAILEKVRQLDEITRSVGGDPRPGPESAPWADSFAAMRQTFLDAGGREIWQVSTTKVFAGSDYFIVVPIAKGVQPEPLLKAVEPIAKAMEVEPFVRAGVIVIGRDKLLKGLPMEKPTRAELLASAISAAGSAPIQIAIIPPPFVVKAAEELIGTLPADLGGGPITIVTRGVKWASAAIALPPEESFHMVIESGDAQACSALSDFIKKLIADKEVPKSASQVPTGAILKRLAPTVRDTRIEMSLDKRAIAATINDLQRPFDAMRDEILGISAASGLKQMLQCCFIYASDNKDQFPDSLQVLVDKRLVVPLVLKNPIPGRTDYVYIKLDPKNQFLSNIVVIHEGFKDWPAEGIWTGFADGHVELIPTLADFQKALKGEPRPLPAPVR